jgi:hypothetical protein
VKVKHKVPAIGSTDSTSLPSKISSPGPDDGVANGSTSKIVIPLVPIAGS